MCSYDSIYHFCDNVLPYMYKLHYTQSQKGVEPMKTCHVANPMESLATTYLHIMYCF